MVSRVVPAISETIALSCAKKPLSSELLPTFGFPIIATLKPSISPFLLLLASTIFSILTTNESN